MPAIDLLTLQEGPDLLKCGLYMGETPGETGAK